MTFTPAELRLLAASDRAVGSRPGRYSEGRPPRCKHGGVGTLTYDQAIRLHMLGSDRATMAEAAGCNTDTIDRWRRTHGLSRPKIR